MILVLETHQGGSTDNIFEDVGQYLGVNRQHF